MINVDQYIEGILRPCLIAIDMYSEEAESLLLGTMAQESRFGTYIKQLGDGPALGFYQMEPATYHDIRKNYLDFRDPLCCKIASYLDYRSFPTAEALIYDLRLQVIFARLHYIRVAEELPEAGDIREQAHYWKKYYNTSDGKGTEKEFALNYLKYLVNNGYRNKHMDEFI